MMELKEKFTKMILFTREERATRELVEMKKDNE